MARPRRNPRGRLRAGPAHRSSPSGGGGRDRSASRASTTRPSGHLRAGGPFGHRRDARCRRSRHLFPAPLARGVHRCGRSAARCRPGRLCGCTVRARHPCAASRCAGGELCCPAREGGRSPPCRVAPCTRRCRAGRLPSGAGRCGRHARGDLPRHVVGVPERAGGGDRRGRPGGWAGRRARHSPAGGRGNRRNRQRRRRPCHRPRHEASGRAGRRCRLDAGRRPAAGQAAGRSTVVERDGRAGACGRRHTAHHLRRVVPAHRHRWPGRRRGRSRGGDAGGDSYADPRARRRDRLPDDPGGQ